MPIVELAKPFLRGFGLSVPVLPYLCPDIIYSLRNVSGDPASITEREIVVKE